MEEILNEILGKLEKITKDMDEVKETLSTLATHEEVGRVAETLQLIATGEVAATRARLEDKIETGDVLNKTLVDGLENRLTEKIDGLKETTEEGFDHLSEGIGNLTQAVGTVIENQQNTANVLKVFLERFEAQDAVINLFDQRLKIQEEATHSLRKAIKKLGGDVS